MSVDGARREASKVLAHAASGDWGAAMRLAEAALPLLLSHAPEVLEAACAAVPDNRISATPRWAALRAHLRMLRTSGRVGAIYAEPRVPIGSDVPPADRVVVRTFRAVALRSRGRFAQASEEALAASDAYRRLSTQDRAIIAGYLATLRVEWGRTLVSAGRLDDGRAALAAAADDARRLGDDRALMRAIAGLALLSAHLGDGRAADAHLAEHDALRARNPRIVSGAATARSARALRRLDALDPEAGLALLDDAAIAEGGMIAACIRATARGRLERDSLAAVRLQLDVAVDAAGAWRAESGYDAVTLELTHGTLLALDGLHEAALLACDRMPGPVPALKPLIEARRAGAQLMLGEPTRAAVTAARTGAKPAVRARVESLSVRAAALRRLGDPVAADLLAEALSLAEENGLWGALLGLPREDLLALLPRSGPSSRLRELATAGDLLAPPPPDGYRRLTRQQLETLRVLSLTDTLDEAATRLSVSVTTAKSHTRAIYRCFGVGDRAAALAEGRRRGLL